jgi:hypothetical protein
MTTVDPVRQDAPDDVPVRRRSSGRRVTVLVLVALTVLTATVLGFVVVLAPAANAVGGCGG